VKSETTAKVTAPVEEVKEIKITKPVRDNPTRNQFAAAVAPYVLNSMDITFLEGHPSVPRFAEKVYILADALLKEASK
jgi:hypothetical protein